MLLLFSLEAVYLPTLRNVVLTQFQKFRTTTKSNGKDGRQKNGTYTHSKDLQHGLLLQHRAVFN